MSIAAPGCVDDASTCELKPGDILITAGVTDGVDGIRGDVRLYLQDGDGLDTSLRLCREQGDLLTLNGISLTESSVDNIYRYTTALNAATSAYEFRFTRDGQIYAMSVDAPPTFELVTPIPGEVFSVSDDLSLSWSPLWPDRSLNLRAIPDDPSCLQPVNLDLDDTGVTVLPAGTLTWSADTSQAAECPVTLELLRVQEGAYPAGLAAGGWVQARVVEQVVAIATP